MDAAQFRLFAENLPALCWMADGDGDIVWFNKRWHDYCGSTPEAMAGGRWATVCHPDRLPEVMQRWSNAIATGESFETTFPLRGADGLYRPFLTRVQPIVGDDGAVTRWFGVSTEVSAQLAAEQALSLEREVGRDILEGLAEGFEILDSRFRIHAVNNEATRLLGRSRDEMMLRKHWDVFSGSETAEIGVAFRRSLAEQKPVTVEYRHHAVEGWSPWLEVRVHPVSGGLAVFYRDVTERRQEEEERLRGAERLQAFLQAVPGVVYVKDREGRMVMANQGAADLVGKPLEAFLGKTDLEFLTDEVEAAAVMATDRRIMESEQSLVLEETVTAPDGHRVTWLSTKSPFRDASGAVIGLVGSSIDYTEHARAREVLARLRQDLERAVAERTAERDRLWNNSQDLLVIMDAAGICRDTSPALRQILGWDAVEVLGRPFLDFVHPDDRASSLEALGQAGVLAGQAYENRLRHKDGGYRWLSWVGAREGDLVYVTGRHVTAEKEASKTLELAQSRIRSIFETSYQFQAFLSPDGVLLDANPASLSAIERRLDEVVGQLFWETRWFSETPGLGAHVAAGVAAVAAGESVRQEITMNLPAGPRSFDFSMRPVRDAGGQVVGIVPEAMEVTERRRAEEALRQIQKMEAVGQLTGGIAHDFNNMLTVVISSLNMLERRLPADDRARRYTEAAKDAARRAALLTKRLLAFARQQTLEPEPVDSNTLVTGMMDLLHHSLGANFKLETVFAPDLWLTHVDPNQLENAVLNLAVNGRDAMGDGGKLTIETRNVVLDETYAQAHPGLTSGQFVLIAVTDTGAGMTADVVAKAFDPFFTTKAQGKGTGLGLSQVYGFVKQSGGHIKIYSEPGRGTTVKVYLPRLQAAGPAEESAGAAPFVGPGGGRQELVLVVEDDAHVRQLSVDALEELGYRVLAAPDPLMALAILAERDDIDLLFSDVVMPDMNGDKLAERARELRPAIRVLLTTGYSQRSAPPPQPFGDEAHFIGKPYNLSDLANKVREVLDARRPS